VNFGVLFIEESWKWKGQLDGSPVDLGIWCWWPGDSESPERERKKIIGNCLLLFFP